MCTYSIAKHKENEGGKGESGNMKTIKEAMIKCERKIYAEKNQWIECSRFLL